MRQALKTMDGPAIYFHTAEIVTDAVLNIILTLKNLYFFEFVNIWAFECGFYYNTYVFGVSLFVNFFLSTYVSFVNQLYLTGIILDRLHSLARAFQYHALAKSGTLRQRGKQLTLLIPLCSCLFFFPYFLFETFRPILFLTVLSDWKKQIYIIQGAFQSFYFVITIALLIIQIIAGVMVAKKYRAYKRNRTFVENKEEVKQQERDKQMLLMGTIGLNIITSVISGAITMAINPSFFLFLFGNFFTRNNGFLGTWYVQLLYIASYIFPFLNGNGALLFHVLLVKSYRSAYKKTALGRLLSKIVHPCQGQAQQDGVNPGQGQQDGTSRGKRQQAGTSRSKGQHAGTSRGKGQQAGTSRGKGQQAGTSRGKGQQAGTSRGKGQQAGTSRGNGQQAGTSRGKGQQAGSSRGQVQKSVCSQRQGQQGQGQLPSASRGQDQQAFTSRGQGHLVTTNRTGTSSTRPVNVPHFVEE